MSAFFVGNKSISRLANKIAEIKPGIEPNETLLAKKLYDMNEEALIQRYPEAHKEMLSPFEFERDAFFLKPDGDAQFYRSLQCYLYQCHEGSVSKSELYKKLDSLLNEVAHSIAGKYADAKGAMWE